MYTVYFKDIHGVDQCTHILNNSALTIYTSALKAAGIPYQVKKSAPIMTVEDLLARRRAGR